MRRLLLALVFVFLALPLPVHAGPLNGSYALDGDSPDPAYIVVLQNDPVVGLAALGAQGFGWVYGIGTLEGSRVTGDLLTAEQEVVGRFDLTFGPEGVFTGTLFNAFIEETFPVVGRRFF